MMEMALNNPRMDSCVVELVASFADGACRLEAVQRDDRVYVVLSGRALVASATALREALLLVLARGQQVELDVSALHDVDLSYFQLLHALRRSLGFFGVSLELSELPSGARARQLAGGFAAPEQLPITSRPCLLDGVPR